MQVAYQDILKTLDPTKICSSVQNFIDIYLRLSGIPANGQLTESDCIRVRICEGRFALLIREVCFYIEYMYFSPAALACYSHCVYLNDPPRSLLSVAYYRRRLYYSAESGF